MFLGLPKDVGGSSGCNILAQRWYGTRFHFEYTYIHTFILSYIHIYIYTYMYLNTHNVCNIGTNILTEKCNGEIFEGG